MTHKVQSLDARRAARLDEAADWIARLENPGRTEADYTDWLCWCDADPENLSAFETVVRVSQGLDTLKADAEFSKSGLPRQRFARGLKVDLNLSRAQKDALLNQEAERLIHTPPQSSSLRSRKRRLVRAAAAAIGAIAVATGAYYVWTPVLPAQRVAAPLANRVATLPDGSRMILGAQSRVDVDFNGPQRRLDLSSGEAYFKVKHDRSRPFVVRAGEVSVTAVGTAFDVRRGKDQVTITVEEGTVDVGSLGPGGKFISWRAEAGYQLTYSTRQRTASIASVNPSAALAWRNGELAYRYEPLGTVIDDLSHFSNKRIIIADPQVAKILFTGTVFASSLDGWLAGIEQAYPVTVHRTATGDIVLNAK